MLQLNIGCSDRPYSDCINIDISPADMPKVDSVGNPIPLIIPADACSLPFKDGTFDNVYAMHILEHLNSNDLFEALYEVARVLKVGGTFYMAFPECSKLCDAWLKTAPNDRVWLVGAFIGQATTFDQTHKIMLDKEIMMSVLAYFGCWDDVQFYFEKPPSWWVIHMKVRKVNEPKNRLERSSSGVSSDQQTYDYGELHKKYLENGGQA